mgnify:CR=1 FL=1
MVIIGWIQAEQEHINNNIIAEWTTVVVGLLLLGPLLPVGVVWPGCQTDSRPPRSMSGQEGCGGTG